jgi:penicillin-binding protein 1A
MPRPPSRTRQLVDPMAAFQMVHVMEGVIIRGTATVLHDLNRPLFGKTGTTNGPTNVWFVGGTPDIVAGVYVGYDSPRPMGSWAQGGRISAPIWKEWALTALKDEPKVPFVAPPGIRWVRIDRATGKPVFGEFPTNDNDPKAPVIWEAFQPQTEAVKSTRSTFGDPYSPQYLQLWQQAAQQAQQPQQGQQPAPGNAPQPAPQVATAPETRPVGLPSPNTP